MLFNLLYQFHAQVPVLNVIQYITFRTAAASLTALVIRLLLGPWLSASSGRFRLARSSVTRPGIARTQGGTPTMGGLLI